MIDEQQTLVDKYSCSMEILDAKTKKYAHP
jgi:hypothetical protein